MVVVIAAYTTAQARLKLYSYLQHLNTRDLYADTDSIVFSVKTGEWEPPLGDFLGDLTDEVPSNSITHFVTGGPKNYAYKLGKPDKDGSMTCWKVRGITLNYKNALDINFETVKDMVLHKCDQPFEEKKRTITVVDEHKTRRDAKGTKVTTKTEEKDYRIVFDQRIIRNNYSSEPYGM